MKSIVKKLLYVLLTLFLILIISNISLISYGVSQAKGQFSILWNVKTIEETIQDPAFPDSLKSNLKLVTEIKQYAIDSLGLKPTKNYTTVFDQKGKDVLWVVSACEPFAFEPRMWKFPIIGSFTYKGFFDKTKAREFVEELKQEGLDLHVRPVSGWSTLGWFKDPILSNMLSGSVGELANTIIHELTHGTIFVPDSMTFNENLATFIGDKGAEKFLAYKYGDDSDEFINYSNRKQDSKKFTKYVVSAANNLDSLYNKISEFSDSVKLSKKTASIDSIIENLDTVQFVSNNRYNEMYLNYRPNNAYFISFLNYRERQDELEAMLYTDMDSSLLNFIGYWKANYLN